MVEPAALRCKAATPTFMPDARRFNVRSEDAVREVA
jgi:hypothetical protein